MSISSFFHRVPTLVEFRYRAKKEKGGIFFSMPFVAGVLFTLGLLQCEQQIALAIAGGYVALAIVYQIAGQFARREEGPISVLEQARSAVLRQPNGTREPPRREGALGK